MGASIPGVCPDLRHAKAPTANPTYTSLPLVTKKRASASGVSTGGLGMAKVMAKHWRTSPHYYGYPLLLVLPILSFPTKHSRHAVQSFGGTVKLMPLMSEATALIPYQSHSCVGRMRNRGGWYVRPHIHHIHHNQQPRSSFESLRSEYLFRARMYEGTVQSHPPFPPHKYQPPV